MPAKQLMFDEEARRAILKYGARATFPSGTATDGITSSMTSGQRSRMSRSTGTPQCLPYFVASSDSSIVGKEQTTTSGLGSVYT